MKVADSKQLKGTTDNLYVFRGQCQTKISTQISLTNTAAFAQMSSFYQISHSQGETRPTLASGGLAELY